MKIPETWMTGFWMTAMFISRHFIR